MRLIVVSQDFPPDIGGTQTYASEIAARWARTDEVTVVAPRVPGCDSLDEAAPYRVLRVESSHNAFAWNARRILTDLKIEQPDARVFCVQWTAALAAQLGGWPPSRIVLAAHGRELLFNPLPRLLRGLYNTLRHAVLQRVARIVPVSHYTAELVKAGGIPDDRITVVPNGTDPDRFRPRDAGELRRRLVPDGGPLLLTVCRLVPRKGVDTLIRSLPDVRSTHAGATLVIVGAGPERPALDRLVESLGLGYAVRFAGAVPFARLPEYFSAADLFVMTPRTAPPDVEGFGLVYLEASACGTPVIGARSGGIPDAIVEGETGILVEPDRPDDLARAICELLATPDRLAAMGRAGRAHAEGPGSWDRVAADLRRELEQTFSR